MYGEILHDLNKMSPHVTEQYGLVAHCISDVERDTKAKELDGGVAWRREDETCGLNEESNWIPVYKFWIRATREISGKFRVLNWVRRSAVVDVF